MPVAIDHLALVVRDPARSARLFADVFADARVTPGAGDHDTLVHLAGTCFVLVQGEPPATRNGDHIAFAMDKAEQLACAARLQALGIDYQLARHDTALYFADYDNHTFELDVTAPA